MMFEESKDQLYSNHSLCSKIGARFQPPHFSLAAELFHSQLNSIEKQDKHPTINTDWTYVWLDWQLAVH